ncbi:MAG: hypothetical protein QNK27_00450, partial [Desulfuromusa sp.]|nr:hypothetical protein [Desulfuromusa sp.]
GGIRGVQQLREKIEQTRLAIAEAERDYDLNRAAELKHGRLPELERQLQAEEQQMENSDATAKLLRE